MATFARLMVAVLVSIALLGHGHAQTMVAHVHGADIRSGMEAGSVAGWSQHDHEHVHGVHSKEIREKLADAATACGGSDCNPADHSNGEDMHVHVSCCGFFAAIPPANIPLKLPTLGMLDEPALSSAVRPGSMLYPLLRPPRFDA